MENRHLELARLKLEQENFIDAKKYFELHIKELNEDLQFDNLSQLLEIRDDYINVLCMFLNLDISENNSLFKKFDETKLLIKAKFDNGDTLSEYEDNVRKLIIYQMDYTIHWGNYAGSEIESVIRNDPEYVLWCIINLEHFAIDNVIFLIENVQEEPEFATALEINLIKHLIVRKWGTDNGDDDNDRYNRPDDYDDGPSAYGYDSWDEMAFYEAFDGDPDAWDHYNQ